MKTLINAMLATALVLGGGLLPVDDAEAGGGRFARQNSAGGVTGGSTRGRVGQHGAVGRTSGVVTDGQGNVEAGGARGFQAPNAQASGSRRFSRDADGSLQRNSNASGSGLRGSYDSTGNLTRDADGQVNGERQTEATGIEGNSYSGSTTYSGDDGVNRSTTCYDASGQVVSCPR
jgi:hypothetical protein